MDLGLRTHPTVLFAYTPNHIDLVIRVENAEKEPAWVEADISVPQKLSLAPTSTIRKGRIRIGILESEEFVEKAIRVYANTYTNPQMYRCKVTSFLYTKNGVIGKRIEKGLDVRCEIKKKEHL